MNQRVFVTGLGAVSPVGLNLNSSWESLIQGKSGINQISSFDTENLLTTIAAEIPDFDPVSILGLKESARMDRFVQLACVASLEAVAHANLDINPSNSNRISVNIASGIGGIITLSEQIQVLDDRGPTRVSPFLVPMMLPDMASGRVSMLLGAKGPNYSAVSACASSADSIGLALESIRRGDVDVAITGGAEAAICPIGIAGFNACKALSRRNADPQKASRPFDSERDGFVLGEGAGILILESESSVSQRGIQPIAEIAGYGSTADAYHITQPAPEGEGGARAMKIALTQAQTEPQNLSYINAHGTSTPLNDKYETMAMKSVLKDSSYDIPISSTKSMTGHLLGASGALEAVISVMSIKTSMIPPTINLDNPDSECDLNYTPHVAVQKQISTVMSNSFGFGGHNASLIFRST
ncbi:MAG: beta-ketoacyl-ACP synthase II [Dehalococcoidia bacterium]